MKTATALPPRNQIPVRQTWDLEAMFPTPADWERTMAEVQSRLAEIKAFQGRLGEGPATLLAYFRTSESIARLAGKATTYANLQSAADSTDQEAQARVDQGRGLAARLNAAAAFAEPELIGIGFETLREWMRTEQGLTLYAHYFERLENRAAHVRSGEVEEVLALAQDPLGTPRGVYGMLTNADMRFADAVDAAGQAHPVGQGTIDSLLHSTDRELRRTAFFSYADGYEGMKNTLAATLLGAVKNDVFAMRVRGHRSSLVASLAPNRIPEGVFHNLINVFKQNLPLWHRYWRIRKKALGVETLHWYDTVAPLSKNPPVVSFEQAVHWIADGMRPLGGDYTEVLRAGCLDERWVDYAINQGKRAGAFSSGSYDTYPYIMMSYGDDLFSLSTLAHELGHSMHSYLARKTQPYVYAGYSLFVAEVASNFNQALTRAYLFATQPDRDFQLTLIDEAMSNFRRYFFIMPTLARFELEMHERVERGAAVNARSLIDLCADLFGEGFGDALEMDRMPMGLQWAEFGHLYSNFYVYQYATGIAGAHALADQVLNDPSGAPASNYLEFLRTGGGRYPIDALRRAGVDLQSPEPVEKAFATLAGIVDRLESLVG